MRAAARSGRRPCARRARARRGRPASPGPRARGPRRRGRARRGGRARLRGRPWPRGSPPSPAPVPPPAASAASWPWRSATSASRVSGRGWRPAARTIWVRSRTVPSRRSGPQCGPAVQQAAPLQLDQERDAHRGRGVGRGDHVLHQAGDVRLADQREGGHDRQVLERAGREPRVARSQERECDPSERGHALLGCPSPAGRRVAGRGGERELPRPARSPHNERRAPGTRPRRCRLPRGRRAPLRAPAAPGRPAPPRPPHTRRRRGRGGRSGAGRPVPPGPSGRRGSPPRRPVAGRRPRPPGPPLAARRRTRGPPARRSRTRPRRVGRPYSMWAPGPPARSRMATPTHAATRRGP